MKHSLDFSQATRQNFRKELRLREEEFKLVSHRGFK